jgi:hypothetical protein
LNSHSHVIKGFGSFAASTGKMISKVIAKVAFFFVIFDAACTPEIIFLLHNFISALISIQEEFLVEC